MAIEAHELSFAFGRKLIIKNCSFRIERGKVYAILGRNGSGKTTLLRLLNGTLKPEQGTVLVESLDVRKSSSKTIARILGFVPQEHNGVFPYRVLDMVVMGRNPHLSLFARPGKKDYKIAEEALDMVGVWELKERSYMEISGGEKQMVFLARAIAQEASYFILDEPTSHLDFCNQRGIMTALRSIVKTNDCAAIIAMHDPNLTLDFADEVLMLKDGSLFKEGQGKEIMNAENLSYLYDMDIKIAKLEAGRQYIFT